MKLSSAKGPAILAHRGATVAARENSAHAIREARTLGADGVEIDVRMTLDGRLVLAHDPGANGTVIAQTEFHVLRRLVEIDLLDEGLPEASGLMVDLEMKGPVEDPRALIQALDSSISKWDESRCLITSFWVQILTEAQAAFPSGSLGVLSSAAFDEDGFGALNVASEHGFSCILPSSASVSAELIQRAHSAGVSVIAWTENELERFRILRDWGIDGVITDRPADLLTQR